MQTIINRKKGVLSVAAVALLVAVCLSPVLMDESDAANPTKTLNLQPGQSWSWTPTFPVSFEIQSCVKTVVVRI